MHKEPKKPELLENTEAERIAVGAADLLDLGDRTSRYFVFEPNSGFLIYTNQLPLLETPITDQHTHLACKIGQGHDCCRYLTMSSHGWSCEKFAYHRRLLDDRVERSKVGIAGADSIVAWGDNCEGRMSR